MACSPDEHPTRVRPSFALCGQISKVAWPTVPNPWTTGIFAILYQMDRTQWLPADELRELQLQQAAIVLNHAYATSPFYRSLYEQAGVTPDRVKDWGDWQQLPLVDRKSLQEAGTAWYSDSPPPDHGEILQHFTSGSTGMPLRSISTRLTHLIKIALALRNHDWAGRDTRKKIVFISEGDAHTPAEGRLDSCWQRSFEHVIKTGTALSISVRTPVADQIDLIRDFEPAYLISYPSVIAALAGYCLEQKIVLPFLESLGTYGEILEPRCRSLARRAWNVPVIDGYSAKEMGPIALQCPHHEQYHVQSDAVILEILDSRGRQCAPGETGRVVLTSLHNFAAPMVRYAIGDYAECGAACECGRGLPVVKRILGRQRNMLTYPDGSERWPSLREDGIVALTARGVPPVRQFQLVQHSTERLEARVVLSRPYTNPEETLVADYLRSQLGGHWQIDFSYPAAIERGPRGKYEDFISHVEANRAPADPVPAPVTRAV